MVDGAPVVFEINPRFSGGIPLTIEAGADFPLMMLQVAAGYRVASVIGCFRDDLWMTNYEASVFLETDNIHLEPYAREVVPERRVAMRSAGRSGAFRSTPAGRPRSS